MPRGIIKFVWTDALDAVLVRLWNDNVDARGIGAQLGYSRSAVLGRIHRLRRRWPGGGQPIYELRRRLPTAPRPRQVRGVAPKSPIAVPATKTAGFRVLSGTALDALREEHCAVTRHAMRREAWEPLAGCEPVALEALGNGCKWPLGDPLQPGFGFCGAPRAAGKSPYCPHHHALAYVAVRGEPSPVANQPPSRNDRHFMGAFA